MRDVHGGDSGRPLQITTRAPDATRAVAATVATVLRPGDVVALTGELGAGKTCFVQGAAAALGVGERVTSPTFVLRREYEGRVPVLHLDVYRLESLQEVLELGYEEALDHRRVTFVEWGDAMAPLLPSDHLEVEFRLPDPAGLLAVNGPAEPRRLLLRAHGPDWTRRLAGLAADLRRWEEDT